MRAPLLLVSFGALALGAVRAEDQPATANERRLEAAQLRALQEHPDEAASQLRYAEFLSEHGQLSAAITHWRAAQILEPGNAKTANSLGGAYLRMGRAAESAAQFQRAIGIAGDVAAYHYNLANVEFMLRHDLTAAWHVETTDLLLRALAEFRAASRLSPNDLEYARSYAESFYGLENPDWKEAEAAWRHVLVISPERDFAYLQLARVSLKRGEKARARLYLDRVNDPRHDGLKQKLRAEADKRD